MLRGLAILFTVLLLNGEVASGHALAAASRPRRHIVEIRDFGFHPARILAAPGDTVVWINRDVVPHTATANDETWDSQELQEGESWVMVVKNNGAQGYFCTFHPHMEGVLESRSVAIPIGSTGLTGGYSGKRR